jgi:hypothetical protein
MSSIDPYDGEKVRTGQKASSLRESDDEDLLLITPVIDDRLKDQGRALADK